MEKAKKKINFCVFVVILTAIAVGILYYHGQAKNQPDISEGTLIAGLKITEWQQLCQ